MNTHIQDQQRAQETPVRNPSEIPQKLTSDRMQTPWQYLEEILNETEIPT
jgi:hypothetical protein